MSATGRPSRSLGHRPSRAAVALAVLHALGAAGLARAGEPSLMPRNPGFEERLRGWREEHLAGVAPGSASVVEANAARGERCLRLAAPAEGVSGATCDPVPVPRGGATLLLRFQYRTEGDPDRLEVRVRPLDEKGQPLQPEDRQRQTRRVLWPALGWRTRSVPSPIVAEASAYDITFWVRGGGSFYVDDVTVRALHPEEIRVPSQGARIKGAGDELWCESAMVKVYPDARPPQAEVEAVQVSAARGECEPFQVVLLPKADRANTRVVWQDLLGPAVLRREEQGAAWVDGVTVATALAPLGRTGWTPDPLGPDEARTLRAGQVQALWLTVRVPRQTPPGVYRGSVRIESDSSAYNVPVRVRVRPFALPEEPTLNTLAGIEGCPGPAHEALHGNLRAHRVSGTDESPSLCLHVTPQGEVRIDTEDLDRALEAATCFAQAPLFRFPGTRLRAACCRPAASHVTWHGLDVSSPAFESAFRTAVAQIADRLRARGWLGKAVVLLGDGPPTRAGRLAAQRASALVRATLPEARIGLVADEAWARDLEHPPTGTTLWARDDRLYSLDVDTSSLAMRAYAWRLKRASIAGAHWRRVNHWPHDPRAHLDQCTGQNGGGFLLYPPPKDAVEPLDSIRWEMYREGVEDYDALTLLEGAHAAARAELAAGAEFDVRELLQQLTAEAAADPDECTLDPRRLQTAREGVDALIELFTGRPPCLVRFTGPPGTLSLEGVTRPGTAVTAGSARVHVDPQGRFRVRAKSDRLELVLRVGTNVSRATVRSASPTAPSAAPAR